MTAPERQQRSAAMPSSSLSPSSSSPSPLPAAPGSSSTVLGTLRASSSSAPKSPPPPARPSLLSRLNLPLPSAFRNRHRNVVDFHIRCDEPYRKYAAGDAVRGAVVLAAVKPVRITHLVVSLHGYVRVLKDPTSLAKAQLAAALPSHGCSNHPQYHGNGLASLFQDEQILSGEGRLEPGRYEFGFELLFPNKELPSSIDFERGTISYMITATITRPTTISPTSTCDRRVMLAQTIDIGMLPPPRPRTIFLEPISKRTRRKRSVAQDRAPAACPDVADLASEAGSVDRATVADEPASAEHRSHIPTDARSEVSGESGRSASTAISRADFAQLSQAISAMSPAEKQQVVDDKTITASVSLIKAGFLPGDTVSVKITVQHIKRVKSMTGVIVTLFRQGRIDTSPEPYTFEFLTKEEEARVADKEEAYPRSRTGLGGLSLTSSSSTSVFRKDLDQNAAPLIIDPVTLQASVTVSVRIPDDAFPTIKGVPGEMINFKYQVEVVVDLGGRLANQLQGGQSNSRFGPYGSGGSDQSAHSYGPRRTANIADTEPLRREKGVISVTMETVVGSTDSSRNRKPTPAAAPLSSPESGTVRVAESDDDEVIRPEIPRPDEASPGYFQQGATASGQANGHPFAPPPGQQPLPGHVQAAGAQLAGAGSNAVGGGDDDAAPSYVPPPSVPDQRSMTEKDRVRQAELRLLPSQPPAASAPSAAHDGGDDGRRRSLLEPGAPADEAPAPSAPTLEDLAAGQPVEDKQELERQRLMNEASAPPEFPDDVERRGEPSSSTSAAHDEPSAPVLGERDVDGHDYGDVGNGSSRGGTGPIVEQLPAYER
ncbi:pH response protein PalF [Drechmeria coniospora]|uniref:pH response protein PalF n=1 Tax=Drechmeria coniospora TaxID=98403 RepID=A0A151GET0_DRECN|nr:pH response protein PalF [Drechmeria coniospora]KYK55599.1 pH response protein PalF [Drechmeria coniospora]